MYKLVLSNAMQVKAQLRLEKITIIAIYWLHVLGSIDLILSPFSANGGRESQVIFSFLFL